MCEEDQETLAAEYVLGTLSAEEREHAEALRSFDPEFDAAVKQWERRLGELNVMVEAVEPPKEVWDKIKSEIGGEAAPEADAAGGTEGVAEVESPATVEDTGDLLFFDTPTQPEPTKRWPTIRPPHRCWRPNVPPAPSAASPWSAVPTSFGCASVLGAGAASPLRLPRSLLCWRSISRSPRWRPI
jgi:hypothetical protein